MILFLLVSASCFICLIVKKSPPLIRAKPALMSVSNTLIDCPGQLNWVAAVGDVNKGEGVLIVSPADLSSGVSGVRSSVDDALDVVGVSVSGVAAIKLGVLGVRDVDHVDTT